MAWATLGALCGRDMRKKKAPPRARPAAAMGRLQYVKTGVSPWDSRKAREVDLDGVSDPWVRAFTYMLLVSPEAAGLYCDLDGSLPPPVVARRV